MSTLHYLIALALIEQHKSRALPLGGKSLAKPISSNDNPASEADSLVLELLVRVLQRTDEGSLKRSYGDKSLIIIQLPIDEMQSKLPILKSDWINSGDTQVFLSDLKSICSGAWKVSYTRQSRILYSLL